MNKRSWIDSWHTRSRNNRLQLSSRTVYFLAVKVSCSFRPPMLPRRANEGVDSDQKKIHTRIIAIRTIFFLLQVLRWYPTINSGQEFYQSDCFILGTSVTRQLFKGLRNKIGIKDFVSENWKKILSYRQYTMSKKFFKNRKN